MSDLYRSELFQGTPHRECGGAELLGGEVNRRASVRLQTVYRVARVSTGGDEGLVRVHNISDEGLRVTIGLPVAVGDALDVELSGSRKLKGNVVWLERSVCGVKLALPMDSAAVLRGLVEERRAGHCRPPRLACSKAVVASSEKGICAVRILDISQHGMKVSHNGNFVPGLKVKVVVAHGLERRGVVRWVRDNLAGVVLMEGLAIEDLGSVRLLER